MQKLLVAAVTEVCVHWSVTRRQAQYKWHDRKAVCELRHSGQMEHTLQWPVSLAGGPGSLQGLSLLLGKPGVVRRARHVVHRSCRLRCQPLALKVWVLSYSCSHVDTYSFHARYVHVSLSTHMRYLFHLTCEHISSHMMCAYLYV